MDLICWGFFIGLFLIFGFALGHSIASHSVEIEAVEHDCATWKIQKDGSTVFSWDKESSGDE